MMTIILTLKGFCCEIKLLFDLVFTQFISLIFLCVWNVYSLFQVITIHPVTMYFWCEITFSLTCPGTWESFTNSCKRGWKCLNLKGRGPGGWKKSSTKTWDYHDFLYGVDVYCIEGIWGGPKCFEVYLHLGHIWEWRTMCLRVSGLSVPRHTKNSGSFDDIYSKKRKNWGLSVTKM